MNASAAFTFFVLALTCSVSSFAQAYMPQTQVQASAEQSQLSNGTPNWRAQSLRIARKLSAGELGEISLTQTRRFGLNDQQISGLYASPLTENLTATLSASLSPSHRVLAKRSLDAALQYEFLPTWLVHAGLSNKRYSAANVNQASLTLEHYFSSFSLAGTWKPARTLGVGANSADLRGTYYYGNANSIGVIVSSGREAATIDAGTVALTDVRGAALVGRHWLSTHWAFSYALSSERQGRFYTRQSVHLGAEFIF